ncbi:MAG: radical SAM protein [Planctomycetota bacterium]
MTRKNILLISPDFDVESFWITEEQGMGAEVLNDLAPVGLATIAALTPDTYTVDVWDEVVQGRIANETEFQRHYDLVGFTGYNSHYLRCVELATLFKERNKLTAVGGPGVSGMPEKYRDHFDILFVGEAERTWPSFLKDWERGCHRSEYRQIEKIDLCESPPPRWDSIEAFMDRYAMGGVQTTRGCPFDCEFCDVIYLFGRRMRHKPVHSVIQEIRALERLGATSIFFCDDEFIGDRRYTKSLLRELIPVNNSFTRPLTYAAQLTMNLSRDKELLELMADVNFGVVFVGIETPNKASLKEANKLQNVREDLVADVRKILSYGIAIRAGLIVGFDHDTLDIFDVQERFVHDTCMPSATLSMLKAIPGTRLWRRLRKEGRVLDITKLRGDSKHGDAFKPRSYTNIVPKQMSRAQLMAGYRKLANVIYSWESFERRIRGFVSNVTYTPRVKELPLTESEISDLRRATTGDQCAESTVNAILTHTQSLAPAMMRKVRMLTLQHVKHKQTFDNLRPYIDRLVELESSGRLTLAQDTREVTIPESFRSMFKTAMVFGGLHERVQRDLHDQSHEAEALTDIFVDFLVRWGHDFERFEPHHGEFLRELSDRTCAQYNRSQTGQPAQLTPETTHIPSSQRARLADDVLGAVEQELMKVSRIPERAIGGYATNE